MAAAEADRNIIDLSVQSKQHKFGVPQKLRFKISQYANPRTESRSWRVAGIKRDGTRVRENFTDEQQAIVRRTALEAEYWSRTDGDTALRATKLTDNQLRIAETALFRLDADENLLRAVENWLNQGRHQSVAESPRLDEAADSFLSWVQETNSLRQETKWNLNRRVNLFRNSVPNIPICDVSPDVIETFLDTRKATATTKDNDRRAISRFFSWCMERKRRWTTINPCHAVKVERSEAQPPAILSVKDCRKLLSRAESYKGGLMSPYIAVCLLGGLRPFEARRLTWKQVNLKDREIRLEGWQTKTGCPRVIKIFDTLCAWLQKYRRHPFSPANWRKHFIEIESAAGYGPRNTDRPYLKYLPKDILRHTAVSHFFRHTGSYGQTAEQFGNSEAVIKKHYQGRVSSEDTKKFYALMPQKQSAK